MSDKTKDRIGSVFILIGLFVLGIGIYHLGYHNGMERIRASESGLGGLAEWAGSWIEMAIGGITIGVGWVIKVTVHNRH